MPLGHLAPYGCNAMAAPHWPPHPNSLSNLQHERPLSKAPTKHHEARPPSTTGSFQRAPVVPPVPPGRLRESDQSHLCRPPLQQVAPDYCNSQSVRPSTLLPASMFLRFVINATLPRRGATQVSIPSNLNAARLAQAELMGSGN